MVDVIWLGHYLLGQNSGLDLIAKVKAEGSGWRSIPVYLVSNTASKEKVQTYMKLGIEKYYTKSDYRLDEIVADIKKHLDSKESNE